MKQKGGIWVPDYDTGILNDMRQVAGVPAYQLDRLERALDHIPVKKRRRAIDVGAHVGLWTLHMARYFKRVEAFEPVPDNCQCWTRNCDHLENTFLHRCAMSDIDGHIPLARTDGTSWSWSSSRDALHNSREHGGVIMSGAATLDSFGYDEVALIKVDVEGHEYEVVKGAHATIIRCQPVVVIEEKHDRHVRASQYLEGLGMREVWRKKHDRVFAWDSQ